MNFFKNGANYNDLHRLKFSRIPLCEAFSLDICEILWFTSHTYYISEKRKITKEEKVNKLYPFIFTHIKINTITITYLKNQTK